ncbi:hypothetical protein AB0B66_26915 [Catellatospora sp. NPDC049111]|uniref:hypothetical protein n=1 Tax=Catellatospora sp. NPDC049111 TaxID=3155271 RepID=UPI0033E207C7
MSRGAVSHDNARGGRVLDRDQFIAYARTRIATATTLLAGHYLAPGGCGCGRPWPCPQQESLSAVAEHYHGRIALLDTTVALPVVTSRTPPTTSDTAHRTLRKLLRRLLDRR